MRFCKRPFENFEIDGASNVFTCCPHYLNSYDIGNLSNNKPEDVWNSEKAQILRQKILANDYSLCNTKSCYEYGVLPDIPEEEIKKNYSPICSKQPKNVWLYYDGACNARCTICRDNFEGNSPERTERLNQFAEEKILPILKDAETVYCNGTGEVFYSEHSQYLVKRIIELYPNIKFDLITNAFLCNRKNIEKLKLENRISHLWISIHAATEQTHKKIFRTGSFSTVLNNIRELKEMSVVNGTPKIDLIFVISSVNYKEIPDAVELAKKYDIMISFKDYFPVERTEMGKNSDAYMIFNPSHPLHNDFLEVLKDERLNDRSCYSFIPLFDELRKKALS